MRRSLLDALRCSHCGGDLILGDDRGGSAELVQRGILYDDCAGYPIVDGIPYLRADATGERALHALGEGDDRKALVTLLTADLPEVSSDAVEGLFRDGVTFQGAVRVLVPGAEGDYLLHRFSDPGYLASSHLLAAVAAAERPQGRMLDFGGGAGHLSRAVGALVDDVTLADVSFPKLWLASRFVATSCNAVCCDGNRMLPFADAAFALVTSSDAFHYVWSRRLLASELHRVRVSEGVLLLSHLHNARVYNPSAGMPLDPAGYRRLFGPDVRLLAEESLLEAALGEQPVDVLGLGDDELASAAALAVVSAGFPLPRFLAPPPPVTGGRLSVNPLYVRADGHDCWSLHPPSPEYAEEYAEMHRYLPQRVVLSDDLVERAQHGDPAADVQRWRRARVLLDLPDHYAVRAHPARLRGVTAAPVEEAHS